MRIWDFRDNGLLMISFDWKEVLLLDVVSGTITWSHRAPKGQQLNAYYHVPSLQNPKGDKTKH